MARSFSAAFTNQSYALTGMTATTQRQFNLYNPISTHVASWLKACGGVPLIARINYTGYNTSTKASTAIATSTDWRHAALRAGCQVLDVTVSLGATTVWKPQSHAKYKSVDCEVPEVEVGRLVQFLRRKKHTYSCHPDMIALRSNSGGMNCCVVAAIGRDLASAKLAAASGSDSYIISSRPNFVWGQYANLHWPNFVSSVIGTHFEDVNTGNVATTLLDAVNGDADSASLDLIMSLYTDEIAPVCCWYEDTPVSEDKAKWKTGLPPRGAYGTETNGHTALGGLQLKARLGSKFTLLADDTSLFATDAASMMVDSIQANTAAGDDFGLEYFLNEIVAKIPRKDTTWIHTALDETDMDMLVPPSVYPRDIIIQNLQSSAATGRIRVWNGRAITGGISLKVPSALEIGLGGGVDHPIVLPGITGALYGLSLDATNKGQIACMEVFKK